MKNQKIVTISLLMTLVVSIGVFSCKKTRTLQQRVLELPSTPFDYTTVNERGSTTETSTKIKDESKPFFNNHTATLGRVLFYDKVMSINNSISCASCHIQSLAFSDGKASSTGFSNLGTPRNAMAILNVADNNNMFWDSRSNSPMDLSLKPVFNHIEMGMESDEMLIEKISQMDYYPELFRKAFNTETVSKEKISAALSAFMSSIYSKNSKFDFGMISNFENFSPLEKAGKDLFLSERMMCSNCHAMTNDNLSAPDAPGDPYGGGGSNGSFGNRKVMVEPAIFVDSNGNTIAMPSNFNNSKSPRGTANIGLDLVYKDNGFNNGQFKIPSLRNIALTGPYMHDGRFATLDQVLNHYSHGIQNHPNLDPKFRFNGQARKINMTDFEKQALLAFLNTLTDFKLINDPKFSDPFVYKN